LTKEASARPDDPNFLLVPIQTASGKIRDLKTKDPKYSNHVQTVADGINLFIWFL